MTFPDKPTGGPGHGMFPGRIIKKLINRTGSTQAKGKVVALDLVGTGISGASVLGNDSR